MTNILHSFIINTLSGRVFNKFLPQIVQINGCAIVVRILNKKN
jgi:hypothetical protein